MADKSNTTICLFNCDNTYKLEVVEAFLMEVDNKHGFNFAVGKYYFRLQQMADICENEIPQIQMDCAIFVLHAGESRLSINEDNAGIGYAKIYRALLQATKNKVLIVIGADDNYIGEDEEVKSVISRWARRKVASQFKEEYLDGRKSFIFSWNKRHREIHEEALLHYFDPNKNGIKFEYQPHQNLGNYQEVTCGDDKKTHLTNENTEQEEPISGEIKVAVERPRFEGNKDATAVCHYPAGTVLLETRLLPGEISYRKWHIVKRKDQWMPSETHISNLRAYQVTEPSSLQFFATDSGEVKFQVVPTTWSRRCIDYFRMCCSCGCIYDD